MLIEPVTCKPATENRIDILAMEIERLERDLKEKRRELQALQDGLPKSYYERFWGPGFTHC